MHVDSVVERGQFVQQYRTGAVIRRHLETVNATAERGSDHSCGSGEPCSNIENAVFGPDLRQLQQLTRSAESSRVEMVKRAQVLGRQALLGIQSGRADGRQDSRFDGVGRVVCVKTSHAAVFVDKILKGARPADIPFEQATKFKLAINLRTAKTLGITIPQSLLLRADEVLQ